MVLTFRKNSIKLILRSYKHNWFLIMNDNGIFDVVVDNNEINYSLNLNGLGLLRMIKKN